MPNPIFSPLQPEVFQKNELTINPVLKGSYEQAKKRAENSALFIKDGLSYIKEKFSFCYYEPRESSARMALPVNNFLKDFSQIETELLMEVSKESPHYLLMNGEMIDVEKVLTMPMEENH